MLLSDGAGNLLGPTDFSAGGTPWSVAAGDVNGDGNTDLVTANGYWNNVGVLLGDGLGNFGAAQTYGTGGNPTSVAISDFNHDGTPDIAAANSSDSSVSVVLGRDNGTFSLPVNSSTGSNRGDSPGRLAQRLGRRGHGQFSGDNASVLINDSWPYPTPRP